MKKHLKATSIILSLFLFISISTSTLYVNAAGLKNINVINSKLEIASGQYDENESNDTFATAYNMGAWKYNYLLGTISSTADNDYFKFYASQGDRFALNLKSIPTNCGYQVTLYDANQNIVNTSTKGNSSNQIIRYIVPQSGNYYVKVTYSSGTLDPTDSYNLEFIDNFKKTTTSFSSLPSTISSSGYGKYSTSAIVNLKDNTDIPVGATVKSINITGNFSPNLGNTYLEVQNSIEGVWHSSRLATSSVNANFPDVTVVNNLPVKSSWAIRYYSQSYSTSKISSLKLNLTYEYDSTIGL